MSEPSPLHFVNVGPDGTFRPSGKARSTPQSVDEIAARVRQTGARKVALHFHGGLVDETAGLEIAARMERVYADAGTYGITVVWETGLLETVRDNLESLNSTALFNKVVNYAIRQVAKRVGLETAVGARGSDAPLTEAEVAAARAADAELVPVPTGARGPGQVRDEADIDEAEIEAELELELAADLEAQEAFAAADELQEDATARGIISSVTAARTIARIVVRTLRRFLAHRDHGVIPTVVEETLRAVYLANLGAWAWSRMKSKAEAMFQPNPGAIGVDSHAGTYLLATIAALQAELDLAVDLVGHSAGSIAIAHLLTTATERHPELRMRHVVLLAPAATTEVFASGILAHQERFQKLRVFTMEDALEARDRLVSGVYPRSLLYFISGVLEPPDDDATLVGLARDIGGQAPYDGEPLRLIHEYLAASDRLVFSKSPAGAAAGMQTAAVHHGDFDDDALTLESLATIVGA